MKRTFLAAAAALTLAGGTAFAHKPSDSFVTIDLEGTTVSGQLDLALKDLEPALGLDADGDGRVTWGELKLKRAAIEAYAVEHLRLRTDKAPCALAPLDLLVTTHTDGAYATLIFDTSCMGQKFAALDIHYDALFDLDAQHRGLLKISFREAQISHVFSAADHDYHFDATGGGTRQRLAIFAREGLHHIFRGYDHMLFLIALVLPAVFFRPGRRLLPRVRLKAVLIDTAQVVTAFTAAHTVSLCLTTFHVITPPPARFVEGLIALTIILTAMNNVLGAIRDRRWIVGFAFGLIHGIGYASVLADLGLEGWNLAAPLIGFNLGVEAAQLIVIGGFLPLAYVLRRTRFYRTVVLYGGSAATGLLALSWMLEQL